MGSRPSSRAVIATLISSALIPLALISLALISVPLYGGSSSLQVKVDTGTVEGKASGPVRSFLESPTLRRRLVSCDGNLPRPRSSGPESAPLPNLDLAVCRDGSIPTWFFAILA